MNKFKELALSRIVFFIGLLWLTVLAVIQVWPASWWMDVRSVRVADSQINKPVVMYVEREIKRNFSATWGITLRRVSTETTYIACSYSAVADYKQGTDLPEVVTLGWWSNNTCETLPAGTYVLNTTWQIHGSGIFPAKTIYSTSNPFEITA
jgi:hypothetical protein